MYLIFKILFNQIVKHLVLNLLVYINTYAAQVSQTPEGNLFGTRIE